MIAFAKASFVRAIMFRAYDGILHRDDGIINGHACCLTAISLAQYTHRILANGSFPIYIFLGQVGRGRLSGTELAKTGVRAASLPSHGGRRLF